MAARGADGAFDVIRRSGLVRYHSSVEMGPKLGHVAVLAMLFAACARNGSTSSPPAQPDRRHAPQATSGTEFWRLVDASRSPTGAIASVELFRQHLIKLPADEIVRLDQELHRQLARAYSWEVWGAAYLINGGCSDDCFEYFRAWLIMQGRTVFEKTLIDPDSLAGYSQLTQPAELEDALGVARDAYHQVTGTELNSALVRRPDLGNGWDFDDNAEMQKRYPRLCQKFGC